MGRVETRKIGSRRNTFRGTSLDCYALYLDSSGRLNNIQLAEKSRNREICGNGRSRNPLQREKTNSNARTDQHTVRLEWVIWLLAVPKFRKIWPVMPWRQMPS